METREYAKKVMSNTSYYALQFGQKKISLTQRLGIIGPRLEAHPKLGSGDKLSVTGN